MALLVEVTSDTMEGKSATMTGLESRFLRRYLVKGLTTAVVEGFDKLQWLLQKGSEFTGIPDEYAPWPHGAMPGFANPSLLRRTAKMLDGETAEVICEWGIPDPLTDFGVEPWGGGAEDASIEIGATVQQVQTTQWLYSDPDQGYITTSGVLSVGYNGVQQGGVVNAMRPQTTVRYARVEDGTRPTPHGSLPGEKAIACVGKVNREAVFGDDPGTWLCTAINSTSRDTGRTWMVSYEFQKLGSQFVSDGNTSAEVVGQWTVLMYIQDDGTPPTDIDLATKSGIDTWPMYQSVNFHDLDLTW